eukprot:evm.model.scf_2338.2 EVM.evm.TU.scf_2338.2   scf_2338:19072-19560(-)
MPGLTFKAIVNSGTFKNLCRTAFDEVDVDANKKLDYKELFIAMLLLYDKINSSLPVHIDVPTKAMVYEYLTRYDKDKTGGLEFAEFYELAKDLFGAGKSWKDSLVYRIGVIVVSNMLIWPVAGAGARGGLLKLGITEAANLPPAVYSFGVQGAVQFLTAVFK